MASPTDALHNLDDPAVLAAQTSRAQDLGCRNFAVRFNTEEAWSGLDLTVEQVGKLIAQRPKADHQSSSCLWLNLWGWTPEHQAIVNDITQHYQLSPRLAHSICPHVPPRRPSSDDGAVSMADIFNAVWHFGTVDFGARYVCVGWNALFFLPHSAESAFRSKPNAVRLWSTILLCDDGTVISVFEDPSNIGPRTVAQARGNQINVFRNLSRALTTSRNALMQVSIRSNGTLRPPAADEASVMSGLLFYYLFDDWFSMFDQVSGSEQSYRRRLELVRAEMMEHAKQQQIDLLHQLGKQLNALRSICKSYQSIIEQLVRNTAAPSGQLRVQSQTPPNNTQSGLSKIHSLPLATITRFERLRDRVDLCAMTEIEECIAEKDNLVQMNFNLIALNQAQTVERLTRTTIFLAKVTTLFLPISLAMSYFSMQLEGLQGTPRRTFWLTFLVVVVLAVAFLTGFEWLTAKYTGQLVYRGLTSMLLKRRGLLKK